MTNMANNTEQQGAPELLERIETREPRRVKVILHNDHYTTMDFVVAILMDVFRKTLQDATRIMLDVHEKGRGECGVYTQEIAETKIGIVHSRAKREGFPLRCSLEDA